MTIQFAIALGLLIGFTIGYPLGLWSSWYTYKEAKKHVER